MIKLEVKQIIGGDGKTLVNVYDGDVDYRRGDRWVNYAYFITKDGKHKKTRPYIQWTAMTNRSMVGGKHQEVFSTYIGVTRSELFDDFDKWCSWAESKSGYMCTDDNLRLYELDKDLLGCGKIYSENTCCFISRSLNYKIKMFGNRTTNMRAVTNGYSVSYKNGESKVVVKSKEVAEKMCLKRDKIEIQAALFENFIFLEDDVIEMILNKLDSMIFKEYVNEGKDMEKDKYASEISSIKNAVVAFIGGNKKSKLMLPEGLTRKCYGKNVKFRVQVSYLGQKYKDSGQTYQKMREAEEKSYSLKLGVSNEIKSRDLFTDFCSKFPELEIKFNKKIIELEHNIEMLKCGMF